jgi:hypothetical protein
LFEKKKFKEGQAEQVLDDLFFEAIKGVEILKPKVVIFENVMGLLFKKNKTYVDKIINKLTPNLPHNQYHFSQQRKMPCVFSEARQNLQKTTFAN